MNLSWIVALGLTAATLGNSGLGQIVSSPSLPETVPEASHSPQLAQQSPNSNQNLSEQILNDLFRCMRTSADSATEIPSMEEIESIATQCVLQVVLLNADGALRADANQRLLALMRATGFSLPKPSSQGEATVALEPLAEGSTVYTIPVTISDTEEDFLLDTGASNSILTSKVATALNLQGESFPSELLSYFAVGEDCAGMEAKLHQIPSLTVGAATVSGLSGLEVPATTIPSDRAGILGLDFLSSFDVTINPATATLQLLPPSQPPKNAIALEGKMGLMTAQARINNQGPFTLMLDTGASIGVISQKVANLLSLPSKKETVEVQGFCGQQTGQLTQLSSLQIGEHQQNQVETVILDNTLLDLIGIDGIVGQNFLNHYRQHWYFAPRGELGFPETGRLRLQAPKTSRWCLPHQSSGPSQRPYHEISSRESNQNC
jgi:predicted aspartyl protease